MLNRIAAILIASLTLGAGAPLLAQDGGLVPDRRAVLTEGTDFYGSDLRPIFDTTLQACRAACLADRACAAFTFNSRAGSCFPKTGVTEEVPYEGAISGRVVDAAAGAADLARQRAGELGFLQQADFEMALAQARGLSDLHRAADAPVEDYLAAAARDRAADPATAQDWMGRALSVTDAPEHWVDYAELGLARPGEAYERRQYAETALSATVNAYLRAGSPPMQATALATMAAALERVDRGRATIPALRLAQALDPRDDTAAALVDAVGTYGFRIDSHEVRADSARPQICAIFTEDLAQAGVDYATYLRLPDPGLAVEATDRQICVTGVSHGARYEITFRAGLPSAAGEELPRDVAITGYVRDRTPAARFPGRAYILPRAAGAGIPVETVNTDRLELRLSRLSDRNLVRAIQGDFFGRPLEVYEIERLDDAMAETLWQGEAEVAMEVNRDVTTRLPLDAVLADAAGAGPGVYVLTAAVPGQDPWDHPPALQWFLVSDIGITTLQGGDGLHALVRSLADAGPKPGARVQLISRANAVLGEAVADDEGHARFPAGMTAGTGGTAPALLTVSTGEGEEADFAFLPLTDPEFDLSDRGVEGREPAPPIDLFLTTDRGAYRAGEAVHVTALARDPRVAALTDLPLTLRLIRPDGVEHARQLVADAGAGGHVAAFPLAGNVPRGTWRVEALADPDAPPLAGQSILVEDFLPERIDFDLTLPEGPLALDQRPEVGISARYLFGAPGADLAVEGDLRLSAANSLPGWEGFRFGAHDAGLSPQFQTLDGGGRTDAEGRATLPVIFPDMDGAAQPLSAAIAVRLVEGSGRPVERRLDRVVMPQGPVPGLRPLFEGGLPEGAEAGFEVIALGPDARPVPATVSWRVNRVETDWQWYVLYGEWQWEPVTTRTPVAEGEAVLSGDGPVTVAVPTDWGEYEIVAEIAGPVPATASLPFSAGWFAPSAGSDTPDRLEVALDRPAYAAGDTATLRLVAQSAGIAQVSVLSDRVIETRMVEVAQGATELPLTVTEDWGAGVYVTASLLRPLQGANPDDRAPVRAMGLAHAAVAPGERQLRAGFEVPEAADPRGPLPVALKVEGVAPGETAFATIAAVDLGILNLTGFDSPDPSAHYFGQRKLGVAVRDSYGRLIDGQTGEMGLVRSGGDAGAGLRMQAPPPTEDLVAFFQGPVQVGVDGYARASFDLPSFNGTVRLMAVVWSPTGVGQAEADVLVRDPVVVTAALPRFLTPGDRSRLRLDFVHASGPAGDMALEVAGEGLDLSAPATVTLAEGGTAVLSLPLTAPEATGLHQIRVTLTTPDGKRLDKLLSLPVQVNDPEVMRQSRFTLAEGETFTFDVNVFAGLIPGTGRATLAAGPVARFDAPGLLSMLDTYPYGCTEQITSRALPLLYLSGLAQDLGVAAEDGIAGRIDEAIAAVLLNQTAGGAFGLWSPDSGDLWLDAFVTDFLSRARAEGHDVPDTAFRAALDNLRNQINYAPDFDEAGGPYAYALMVLAREGAAAIGDLRYYADVRAAAFDTPLAAAQLGAALAAYGDQTRADAMFARAARLAEAPLADEPQVWRADYGTRLRDAGAVLALAAEAGSGAVPQAALADRLAQGIAGRNLSTQEATWALLATHALIDRAGVSGLTVNGVPAQGPLVRLLEDRVAGGDRLAIANGSGAETELTLTTFGVPSEPEPAQGNGYAISRGYYDLDGNPADPSVVAQGDRLVVVLEVQPFAGGAARLMVDDALPAGFEIDNPNLIRAGDIAAFAWIEPVETRMTEFRQDRFLAALDWEGSATFRLAYVVRAVSPGAFHHPAATVVDMYRPDYRARTAAGRVTIAE